jgi:hypothetical protein
LTGSSARDDYEGAHACSDQRFPLDRAITDPLVLRDDDPPSLTDHGKPLRFESSLVEMIVVDLDRNTRSAKGLSHDPRADVPIEKDRRKVRRP